MFIKGLWIVSAASVLANVASAAPQVLNLRELQAICHQYESNDQYLPFTSQFSCSEDRTFWVKKGTQPLPLPNGSEIRIKALIKGNQHQTDWWSIPGRYNDQATSCDLYEQVRGTARMAVTIRSCAELDQIVSEEEFCKGLLMPVWDGCAGDMASGTIGDGHVGNCEYAPTGLVKGCNVAAPAPVPVPADGFDGKIKIKVKDDDGKIKVKVDDDKVKVKVKGNTPHAGATVIAALQQAGVVVDGAAGTTTVVVEGPGPLGAHVTAIKVKDGMFSHGMVQLQADPEKDSMLAKLNLGKGDVIARVNGEKVHNEAELLKVLQAAKKKGAVTIKFRDSRGMFLERTRAEI
jgi:hypothetical protein